MVAVFEGHVLDNQIPSFTDVLIARYVLKRWPHDWYEVKKSILQYEGITGDPNEFDAVKLQPLDKDQCIVTFYLHNSLGWRYTEKRTLRWTAESVERFQSDDHRLEITRQILRDIEHWISKGHELAKGHFPAGDDVRLWNSDHSQSPVTAVKMTPRPPSFALDVKFEDAVVYTAASVSRPKQLPTTFSWSVPKQE
jgi:hypothetical protein